MSVVTQAKVAADEASLERKLFNQIRQGLSEALILPGLLTDISDFYEAGSDSFRLYQWGMAGDVNATPENGTKIVDGGMPLYNQVVPNDRDIVNGKYLPYAADTISSVNYANGFFQSAPFKHVTEIESTVAAALRGAASTVIACADKDRSDVAGTSIGENTLEQLSVAMDAAGLPQEGRKLVVNSKQYHELIRHFSLKNVGVAGGESELRRAFLEQLYGFEIYKSNARVLPAGDANQGLAFVSDAAFWGFSVAPTPLFQDIPSEARQFFGLRSRYGFKLNTFPNAAGSAISRAWLIGKDNASS